MMKKSETKRDKKPEPRPWNTLRITSYYKENSVTFYKIMLRDQQLSAKRFSAFEKLLNDVNATGLNIATKLLPSKYSIFGADFYDKRCLKLATLLREIVKEVLRTDNTDAQKLVGEFLDIPDNQNFVMYMLKTSKSCICHRNNLKEFVDSLYYEPDLTKKEKLEEKAAVYEPPPER